MSDYPFKNRNPLYEGTHHGIRWCIYQSPLSSILNGYARIPDGITINADDLDVHGGITYGSTYGSGQCSGWVGFDTAHTGDAWDIRELRERVGIHVTAFGEAHQKQELSMWDGSPWECLWTVPKLRAECERLCEQIAAKSSQEVQ